MTKIAPLAVADVPRDAAALVLFVEDPDAPSPHPLALTVTLALTLSLFNPHFLRQGTESAD